MNLNKATVLLVEDELEASGVMRCILKAAGYPVLSAPSAHKALEVCGEHRGGIGLLISALQMTGMSGAKLARELEREQPGIRILLISGHADEQKSTLQHPVLNKPFTMDDLLLKAAQVLGSAK